MRRAPWARARPDDLARDLVAVAYDRVGEPRGAEVDAAERDRERKARGNERDDQNGTVFTRD